VFERFFSLEYKEKQKKPCARQRPLWPDKATCAKKKSRLSGKGIDFSFYFYFVAEVDQQA
jgi:hypothetical protein